MYKCMQTYRDARTLLSSLYFPVMLGFYNISNLWIEVFYRCCSTHCNFPRAVLILHMCKCENLHIWWKTGPQFKKTWKQLVSIEFNKGWRLEDIWCWKQLRHPADRFMTWVALDHRCANSKTGELDNRCCQPLTSVVRIDSVTISRSIRAISCSTQVPYISVFKTSKYL